MATSEDDPVNGFWHAFVAFTKKPWFQVRGDAAEMVTVLYSVVDNALGVS